MAEPAADFMATVEALRSEAIAARFLTMDSKQWEVFGPFLADLDARADVAVVSTKDYAAGRIRCSIRDVSGVFRPETDAEMEARHSAPAAPFQRVEVEVMPVEVMDLAERQARAGPEARATEVDHMADVAARLELADLRRRLAERRRDADGPHIDAAGRLVR